MPPETLTHLQDVWVAGQRLRLTRHEGEVPLAPRIQREFQPSSRDHDRPPRPGKPRPRAESGERFNASDKPRPPGKRFSTSTAPGERPARRGPPGGHGAGKAPPRKPGHK